MTHRSAAAIALAALFSASSIAADAPAVAASSAENASALARIRTAAMSSDWAWQQLEALTDRIGPRPAGSAGQAAAIAQVAAAMRALGAQVTLQPTKVPHWVRGEERAQLTDYPGRPDGLSQRLHLTALGGSAATPASGLTARVIVAHDFDDLHALGAQVRGNIVLFDSHFDQQLADNGEWGGVWTIDPLPNQWSGRSGCAGRGRSPGALGRQRRLPLAAYGRDALARQTSADTRGGADHRGRGPGHTAGRPWRGNDAAVAVADHVA